MGAAISLTYRVRRQVAGSFVAMPGVLGFAVQLRTQGGDGLFGNVVTPTATIRATTETLGDDFELVPVICEIAVNGGAYNPVFRGVLTGQDDDGVGLSYTAGGVDELIRRAEDSCMPLYRRPIATATTATSLEDPDDPDWQGGILNRIAWRAGGRPLAQTGVYPSAPFYYEFDESSFTAEWTWVDGEDLWAEALALVTAAGGQLYQDNAGTLRYQQPLSLGLAGGTVYTYTNSVYGRATARRAVRRRVSTVTCRYVQRSLQPTQEIYNDGNPQPIEVGAPLELDLAMQWPIWRYDTITANVVTNQGRTVPVTVTRLSESAQLLRVRITPTSTEPTQLTRLIVAGNPITVTNEGIARYDGPLIGGRKITQRVADSIYIQNPDDARRACRMLYDFYAQAREIITLTGCSFDPNRYVGEYVRYTNTRRGIVNLPCRIANISYDRSGRAMAVDLVPVAGLPTRAEIFIDGVDYADADVRKVGY